MRLFKKIIKQKEVKPQIDMNTDKIRLVYVGVSDHKRIYDGEPMLELTMFKSNVYQIPEGVNLEEACKIVSFIAEKLEVENKLVPASISSVISTANYLDKYGFKKLKGDGEYGHNTSINSWGNVSYKNLDIKALDGVTDLFTISDSKDMLKKAPFCKRYFNWFTSYVSAKEVDEIINGNKKEL